MLTNPGIPAALFVVLDIEPCPGCDRIRYFCIRARMTPDKIQRSVPLRTKSRRSRLITKEHTHERRIG
jgi:hypothetical protein